LVKHCKDTFQGSDNEEINTILRYSQTHILDSRQILEYIPFTSFNIVDKIGEGGFGQVFKARWTNGGVITGWNEDTKSWERIPPSSFVVLKSCNSWEILSMRWVITLMVNKIFSFETLIESFIFS